MRCKTLSTLLAAASMLPLQVRAAEPAYTYVEAAYVRTDIDGVSSSADGFQLGGSVGITEEVFLFADYTDQSVAGIGVQDYEVGAGYAWSVTSTTDLYGRVAYVKAEASFMGFSVDDDGYGVGAGVRGFVGNQLELEASLDYVDLDQSGDDTTFGVSARWHFSGQLAVGLEAAFGNDSSTYGIGLRWSFGE